MPPLHLQVFVPGEAGYPCIRIPSLVLAGDGKTLNALAECRNFTGDGKCTRSGTPICMGNPLGPVTFAARTPRHAGVMRTCGEASGAGVAADHAQHFGRVWCVVRLPARCTPSSGGGPGS